MHIAGAQPTTPASVPPRDLVVGEPGSPVASGTDPRFAQYKVIRRNGSVVGFEPSKITIAMTKAFLAVNGGQGAASARVREQVTVLTDAVVVALVKRKPEGGAIHIEEIQDQVELALMRGGEHEVARAYVLYREKRSQERAHAKGKDKAKTEHVINVSENGSRKPLDLERLTNLVKESCDGLADVEPDRILKATLKDLYDGVAIEEVRKGVVLSARALIEKDPAYSYVTARLLLDALRFEALGEEATQADMATKYPEYFPRFVKHGVKIGLLNEALLQFDMNKLGAALKPERDLQFGYLGLQTLYDRYFLVDQYVGGRRFELPQCFFMRVAMGLALNEVDREARAIEFYNVLSTFDFMSSTPTLFNSGTHRSQLSSCYLTTVADDLDGIYEAIKENALLSKFAGGLGNDWTNVRAMGSHIKGTNGKSQGRRAVPQSGERHRGGREPGWKTQGRGLHVPRDVAPRHRGVPRASQEHGRRPPAHARHEHRELDSGPVHEARRGRRRLDALLAVRRARPARQVRPRRSRRRTSATKSKRRARRDEALQEGARGATCGGRCSRCCSRPGIRGSRSRTRATCARRNSTWARSTAATCARRSRSTRARPRSPCATWARSTCSPT